jgi:hypothetical protein
MGGQVFVPDHGGKDGLRTIKYGSPFLDEPVGPDTEQWHFVAYDNAFFYCFAMGTSFPPWIPCVCEVSKIEEIEVNPDSLGNGPYRTSLHRLLIKDQPILTAPLLRPVHGYSHVVGIRNFGVFVCGEDENDALLNLPKWLGLFGITGLQQGYNQNLARHVMDCSTNRMMNDLRSLGERIGEELNDPSSKLNQTLNTLPE